MIDPNVRTLLQGMSLVMFRACIEAHCLAGTNAFDAGVLTGSQEVLADG